MGWGGLAYLGYDVIEVPLYTAAPGVKLGGRQPGCRVDLTLPGPEAGHQVQAGAEMLSRAAYHDYADVQVLLQVGEELTQLLHHFQGHGVAPIGTIEREPAHMIADIEKQSLVFQRASFFQRQESHCNSARTRFSDDMCPPVSPARTDSLPKSCITMAPGESP